MSRAGMWRGLLRVAEEDDGRRELLEGVRRGDATAIAKLWRRFRLRLEIPGPPSRRRGRPARG